MIRTGMQRMSSTAQAIGDDRILRFDTLIDSWSETTPSPLSYSSGYFYIQSPHLMDYLIIWTLSIKTSTIGDGFGNNFTFYAKYGNGEITDDDFSSSLLGTTVVKGFKYLHVTTQASTTNIVRLFIQSCSFYNTAYLTPTNSVAGTLAPAEISNATISILSI